MKKYKIFFLTVVISILASGCVYDFIVPEPAAPPPSGGNGQETVSFKTDIIPIFSAAKCTDCHKPGGSKPTPDLTAANAYSSIATTKYVNVDSPESSYLYQHIYADQSSPHIKHNKFTSGEADLILTWIAEGAKNN